MLVRHRPFAKFAVVAYCGSMNCHCGKDAIFDECCGRFIAVGARPSTAEELMRSRYSAYAIGAVDYLIRTVHPKTREFHRPESVGDFSSANKWLGLEIIATEFGGREDKTGVVEFRAKYRDSSGIERVHHEKSNFRKELGRWFFVDGEVFA